jgi:tRNA 2-thiouridine synthesizing protein A
VDAVQSRDAPTPDAAIDITADACPMTVVRTRLALDRLGPGAVLAVRLRGAEPRDGVPRAVRELGHAVLDVETDADGTSTVLIRVARAAGP